MSLLAAPGTDFWRWQPHPEVWLLVGGVVVLAIYALRVIGPKVVPTGTAVISRSQLAWLVLGEIPTIWGLVGGAICLVGVGLTRRRSG